MATVFRPPLVTKYEVRDPNFATGVTGFSNKLLQTLNPGKPFFGSTQPNPVVAPVVQHHQFSNEVLLTRNPGKPFFGNFDNLPVVLPKVQDFYTSNFDLLSTASVSVNLTGVAGTGAIGSFGITLTGSPIAASITGAPGAFSAQDQFSIGTTSVTGGISSFVFTLSGILSGVSGTGSSAAVSNAEIDKTLTSVNAVGFAANFTNSISSITGVFLPKTKYVLLQGLYSIEHKLRNFFYPSS